MRTKLKRKIRDLGDTVRGESEGKQGTVVGGGKLGRGKETFPALLVALIGTT